LPLVNFSHDPDQEYFADGMTEALITGLAQALPVRVISRTSVLRYKGGTTSLPTIGKELNVDALLEGSVFRSGERVRITVQLIYARDDRHIWARSYERNLQDVLALQNDLAEAIAGEIRIKLEDRQNPRGFSTQLRTPAHMKSISKGDIAGTRGLNPVSIIVSSTIEVLLRWIPTTPSLTPDWQIHMR
jgi:TolB-like protein